MLYLAASQDENTTPYVFKETGVRVYTLEECAYHIHQNWQSFSDESDGENELQSEEFCAWVRECLGLPLVAAKIRDLKGSVVLGFLSLIDFYDEGRLAILRDTLARWEQRQGWERLKEKADSLYNEGEAQKAASVYRRALSALDRFGAEADTDRTKVQNNYAMSLMRLHRFGEASDILREATRLAPENPKLWMALAEACIRGGASFEEGLSALEEAMARTPKASNSVKATEAFLIGLAHKERGDFRKALEYFQSALSTYQEDIYIYAIVECYVSIRMYDLALETLEMLLQRDVSYYIGVSEVRRAQGNLTAAIRAIEQAIAITPESSRLWVKMAKYYRLGYDLDKAEAAARKGLELATGEQAQRASFELARVRKAQGQGKEYQSTLAAILRSFKQEAR